MPLFSELEIIFISELTSLLEFSTFFFENFHSHGSGFIRLSTRWKFELSNHSAIGGRSNRMTAEDSITGDRFRRSSLSFTRVLRLWNRKTEKASF